MDGLSRTVGVGPTIQLGGRTLTVNGKILRHYAEIEAEIVKRRGNPFDLIRQAKDALADSPDIVRVFVERAFDEALKWKNVSQQDLGEFLGSIGGSIFALWLAVRDNDRATLTLEAVTQMYTDEYERQMRKGGASAAALWQNEIERAIDQASGDDELGNSTGSPASEAAESQPAASLGT